MPYTHLPIPVWARAVLGGASALILVAALVGRAVLFPGLPALEGLPLIGLATFLTALGLLLIVYGIRIRHPA